MRWAFRVKLPEARLRAAMRRAAARAVLALADRREGDMSLPLGRLPRTSMLAGAMHGEASLAPGSAADIAIAKD